MKLRDWMKQQSQDVSEIKKNITSIQVENAQTKSDIRHHIKRTNLLEENVKYLRREFNPVKTHVAVMGALGKILIALFSMGAAAVTIYKVFL